MGKTLGATLPPESTRPHHGLAKRGAKMAHAPKEVAATLVLPKKKVQ